MKKENASAMAGYLDVLDHNTNKLKLFVSSGEYLEDLHVVRAFSSRGPTVTIIEVPGQRWELYIGSTLKHQLAHRHCTPQRAAALVKLHFGQVADEFILPQITEQLQGKAHFEKKPTLWTRITKFFKKG